MVPGHCDSRAPADDSTHASGEHSLSGGAVRAASDAPSAPVAEEPRPGCSRLFLGLLSVCVIASAAALAFGNPATKVLVPLVALATLNGYWVGGMKVLSGILGLVIGGLLALPLGQACEGLTCRWFGLGGLTGRMVSIVAVGILLAVFAATLLDFLVCRRLRRRPGVLRYDKWLGSGLGMAQGVLVAFTLLWGILVLEPVATARLAMEEDQPGATKADPAASGIVNLVQLARGSFVGRIAAAANPLAESRIVTLPGKCVAMLGDPVALEAFNRHPAIEGLSEHPVVKEVIAALAEDPQISEMIKSDEALSPQDLLVILGSPRLLEILDATDILAELSPLAEDIERALNESLDHAAAQRELP